MSKGYFYLIVLGVILIVVFLLDRIFGVEFIEEDGQEGPHIVQTESPPATERTDQPSSTTEATNDFEQEEVAVDQSEAEVEIEAELPRSFEDRISAYQDSIQSTLARGERRQDVVVRYYPHIPDGETVYGLGELGFYVHQRTTTEGLESLPTNSIYYGDDVDVRDIQLVAMFLMGHGIELRQVRPSRYHADWKSNAIEIGSSAEAMNREVLTLDDLERFEKEYE